MKTGMIVRSVPLVLFNGDGKVFCLRELVSKPDIGKIVGSKDYSVPWETQEVGEEDGDTLRRLLREEVDATGTIVISEPFFLGKVPVYETTASAYAARFMSGPQDLCGTHAGSEFEPLGWRSLEFLLSRCRDGIVEVVGRYQSKLAELKK
ncbi:MAG: hypothetical protein ABI747_02515 [Candidatus Moraniibacteriota bacterium]